MRFLLRLIVVLAVLGVLVYMVLPRWSGNLDFLENIEFQRATEFLRNIELPQFVRSDQGDDPNMAGPPQPVTRFTWQGDEILHNGTVISETEFANLVREVKANDGKVEIIRTSDVTVEAADHWNRLLDQAAVRYEVIPQE
jgi:hypothetical protein